jgi:hypothetical protein
MTPFSYIIIFFWIFSLAKNKIKNAFLAQLAFTIFISVFVEVGYFLDSDIVRIEFWHISSILTFITAIPLFCSQFLIKKKLFIYLLSLSITLFLLIFFPVNQPVVIGASGVNEEVMSGISSYIQPHFSKFSTFYFFFAVIQAFSIQVAFTGFKKEDYYYLIHKLSLGSKLIILIVLAEIILKYWSINVYSDLLIEVFGLGSSTQLPDYSIGNSFMLQGLTREGSHLAYSLFTALTVIFVESKISSANKQNKFFIILGIIELSISMAFTSLLVFTMLLLMYIVYRFYHVTNKGIILKYVKIFSTIILVSLLLYPLSYIEDGYYFKRFLSSFDDVFYLLTPKNINVLSGLTELSSTTARIYSIIDNLSLIQYRPFFGVGIGTNFSHGSTALTLGETGILGLMSFVYFYFFSIPINNKKIIYWILIFIWLVGNIFVSRHSLIVRMDSFLFFVCLYFLLNNDNILNLKKKTC